MPTPTRPAARTPRKITAYQLLTRIRRLILTEPRRYNQLITLRTTSRRRANQPSCGTIGCIAGWTVVLTHRMWEKPMAVWFAYWHEAKTVLQLTSPQAMELFRPDAAKFRPGTPEHAKAGAAHIRRFQTAHEAKLKRTLVPLYRKDATS